MYSKKANTTALRYDAVDTTAPFVFTAAGDGSLDTCIIPTASWLGKHIDLEGLACGDGKEVTVRWTPQQTVVIEPESKTKTVDKSADGG